MPNTVEVLTERCDELRVRLLAFLTDDGEPDDGSDADILIGALCGTSAEAYMPRLELSGAQLAEQGGRLEARLAGLRRWGDALASVLAAMFPDDPDVRADGLSLLVDIVSGASVAVTRGYHAALTARALAEAERARRGQTRLQALQRINSAANSTLDLDQTLTTTARAVAEEMGADLCVVFLFDEITRELQLRATSGPFPRNSRHFTLPLGEGYTGWVAEHGHPLLLPDAQLDPRFSGEASAYTQPYHALLSVPIIFFTVEKLEGVISVQKRDAHAFTEDEINFLEIVAGQLAMSIENGRLYEQTDEELRRKVHELSTLHRVSAMVASTLVLDNVLRMIVAQAVQLSGADRSVLFQLDATTGNLAAVASHGFDDPAVAAATVRIGQCCAGRVVQTGEPSMHVDCMRNDGGCFLHALPDAVGDQHSVLCAPLVTRHGPIGALCVTSSQRHLLNNHQLQLVMTFANVAAIALENARLFEETREGLRTKEVLLREMHHRVKNNLQQVAAILNMQRRRARVPEVEQMLVESVDRIQGIAATHDLLSTSQLGMARVDEIARKIAGIVRGNLVPPHMRIRFVIGDAPFQMPTEQATTLAIVLNELISNAIEHGFAARDTGEIRIGGRREGDTIYVRVADDGQGPPPGFVLQTADGLGLQLVRGLVRSDLHGSVEFFRADGDPMDGVPGERLTDPALRAVDVGSTVPPAISDGDPDAEDRRIWSVFELRYPAMRVESVEAASVILA